MARKIEEPWATHVEDDEIIIDGPGSINSLTPAAARAIGEQLIAAAAMAEECKEQNQPSLPSRR